MEEFKDWVVLFIVVLTITCGAPFVDYLICKQEGKLCEASYKIQSVVENAK